MRNKYLLHFQSNRLFYRGLHITMICLLLLCAMPVSAQIYSTAQGSNYGAPYGASQSSYTQEAAPAYNAYQSTVHQPFGASTPNMISGRYNTSGLPSTGDSDPNNPNIMDPNNPEAGNSGVNTDDWLHPSDPEDNSNQSPVGEAWVMLLFAAVSAWVVFVRQKRAKIQG